MSVANKSAKDCLQEFFGFDSFKGDQEKIINNLLAGNDTFVIMPTGGGKSLCYQVPTLCHNLGVSLVISPLISLMHDQVSQLLGKGNKNLKIECKALDLSRKSHGYCDINGHPPRQ